MSSHANSEFKEKSSRGMEWGIVIGLVFLLGMFELVPASEMGRLSTRTADSEMEAVETDIAFDDAVEDQEEEVEEEQEEIEEETEQLLEEIETDITISLSEDTTGLETVETVSTTELFEGSGADLNTPCFTPVEVFANCTYQPRPDYPDLARQAGVEGVVTLWLYINTDGTVGSIQLYNSSGVTSLDNAAMEAAWRTRWTPALNNGIPVTCWTTLQFVFTLED